ncbi:uncharacterized protein NMK_3409 [Novimethylophilus kurashikiensis]|uniref:Uncharacterized protein n=1 Tax=Novimethylophilus kurashikiensis TaxID=1825523 RepID=A0A2R5FC57_9PROT|nr:uncharacterized protein NMK_3409 [Novimethylophilus kurashikiensis]
MLGYDGNADGKFHCQELLMTNLGQAEGAVKADGFDALKNLESEFQVKNFRLADELPLTRNARLRHS